MGVMPSWGMGDLMGEDMGGRIPGSVAADVQSVVYVRMTRRVVAMTVKE